MNIGGFPSLFSKGVHICLGALGKSHVMQRSCSLWVPMGDSIFCCRGVRQGGMGCGQGCGVSLITLVFL